MLNVEEATYPLQRVGRHTRAAGARTLAKVGKHWAGVMGPGNVPVACAPDHAEQRDMDEEVWLAHASK